MFPRVCSRLILILLTFTKDLASTKELKSSDIFPDDYNKHEPPFTEESPAHVYIKISIMDLDKIDDGAMEFSLQCYLGELWKDHRINLSSFPVETQVSPTLFPSYLTHLLWVPDLVFDNTKRGQMFQLSLPNTSVRILDDGSFLRSSRYHFIVSCRMDFHFYPVDTQMCFLKIATLTNPDSKVLLHWAEDWPIKNMGSLVLMEDIQPLEYDLPHPVPYISSEEWTSGNYTYLYANFTFVRRLSGSLFNVYVPSTLVVLLSWISFWLDVNAVPARVTLGVTSLLTLATQVVQAHTGLPRISYMTAMDVWLFACLFTVFSSLIEFAFSYQLFILQKQKSDVEEHSQAIRSEQSNINNFLRKSNRNQNLTNRSSSNPNVDSACTKLLPVTCCQNSLDAVSRKLFPFGFILFAVFYWTYYLLHK